MNVIFLADRQRLDGKPALAVEAAQEDIPMPKAKMLPGTRPSKEMLSTRVPPHLNERMQAFKASSRYTIEEIVAEAVTDFLDAKAPETKARYVEPVPVTPADRRMDALESKLDEVLNALRPARRQQRKA